MVAKIKQLEKKTHDEVKEHHKKLKREEKFNQIPYKYLKCGKKTLGKIKSKRIKPFEFTTKRKDKYGKEFKIIRKKTNFAMFTLADNKIGITDDISIWKGEAHFIIPEELLIFNTPKLSIHIPTDIDVELYKGYILPSNYEHEDARRYVDHEYSKSAMDYEVNAHATQLIKLSNLMVEYGHMIEKLQKEKEIEEAKKQRKIVG